MLVRCLRASLLFVLLLFPALTFQSDLNGPNVQMVPVTFAGESAQRPQSSGADSSRR